MNIYRFAPSPTGYLHVGGARTAIFNWLLAKQSGGKFFLRIEDTDAQRSSNEYINQILNSLKWLGLDWEEPLLFQSNRKDRYLEVVKALLEKNKAYYCFCSPQELKQKREIAEKNKDDYVYDKTCRTLSQVEIQKRLEQNLPFTIRLKTGEGDISYNDKIMGKISSEIQLIGDIILIRSDGNPVYQLAVVVDDHDMGVTDIIRGADHIANTAKQILIFKALQWDVPQFGHLPLILGQDKKRLSKRHGATAVEEFKNKGILSQALFNYLCLLGWAPGDDMEIFSKEKLIHEFKLENVNKSNAVFDEKKLFWMNAKYISEIPVDSLLELNSEFVANKMDENEIKSVKKLAKLVKIRAESVNDFNQRMHFFYNDPTVYNEKGIRKYFNIDSLMFLQGLMEGFGNLVNFTAENIEKVIREFAEENNESAAKIIHPLRLALTGDVASPGIFEIVEILGEQKVNRRLKKAIGFIKNI